MKKFIYTMLLALPFVTMGCSETEKFFGEDGEGKLFLSVGVSDSTNPTTRALSDDETAALLANCRIRVYDNEKSLIRKYEGIGTLPSEGLLLVSGDYSTRVTAGDSVDASFSKRYFVGREEFTIAKGEATNVTVGCKIQNTLVKVKFDSSLEYVLQDCKLTVGVDEALSESKALEFTTDCADSTGYYMLPADSTLYWRFSATSNAGEFVRTGSIENVKGTTLYTLTCNFTPSQTETGGGLLKLGVDVQPLEVNTSEIDIYQRPSITGMNTSNETFSLDEPTYLELGTSDELSLWIATSCVLDTAMIECNNFTSWGLPENSMDLVRISKEEKANLSALGLVIKNTFNLETYQGNMGIRFTSDLMKKITAAEGEYKIQLTAIDEKGNSRTATWTIVASDATVVTSEIDETEVYTSYATVRAKLAKDPESTVTFSYRDVTTSTRATAWTTVAATVDKENRTASAKLTGLTAGHKYEYYVADGTKPSTAICSFTTESAAQPENASFEYWSGSLPMYLYGSGQDMWWDTGNGGSKTAGVDLTTPDDTYKHSGNYSARLKSQKAAVLGIGKFAAGNAFVGKYVRTDGTNGVLGWGRPFASRPTKLKGYVRYECGVIDLRQSGAPEDVPQTGENDNGQIYIALGDWAGETDSKSGETWPVIIKTKSAELQLFNSEDAAIIAYGQQTFTESTSGDGMIEFTIDLDYRSTRKPTSIIIVASASKYGDYFTGSTSSTMWIDDFELVYE